MTDLWTPEQVENLKRRQAAGWLHPYTCGVHGGGIRLTPTTDGWKCGINCGYVQRWAHQDDLDGTFPANPFAPPPKESP